MHQRVIVVGLPILAFRPNNYPNVVGIVEQTNQLAQEIETMLGLEHHAIKPKTEITSSGSFAIELPQEASQHPGFVRAWEKLAAFSKNLASELSSGHLKTTIDFYPSSAT